MVIPYCLINLFFLWLFSFFLSRIHFYYHSKSAISSINLSLIAVFTVIGAWSSYALSTVVSWNDEAFNHYLHESFPFSFLVYSILLLLITNQFWIDKHVIEQERLFQQFVHQERELARAELSNIQEQFRPHFIFNSLNSISALTAIDPEKARVMIQQLSDFLRASVKNDKNQFHSLKEELVYLKLYLNIEHIRFEDRLKLSLDELPAELDEVKIPILILQPAIENAIKYGVYGTTNQIEIKLMFEKSDQFATISISNPYDEINTSSSMGKGYGLDSIRKKMYLLYQRNDLIQISKNESVFSFQLKIPMS